jgi:heme-degrading monooxygenase HmoA
MLCKSGDYEAEGWLGPEEFNRKMMSGSPGFFPCQATVAAAHSKDIEHMGGVIELQLARPSQEIDGYRVITIASWEKWRDLQAAPRKLIQANG